MAELRICSVDGCGKPAKALGWCYPHYHRWRRNGDPLGGRESKTKRGAAIAFYEDTVVTWASEECLVWPFARSGKGYGQITIQNKRRIVSRLACAAVNGPPPSPKHEAAHSCGNGHLGCVNPRHLSWKTKADNEADKQQHGRVHKGEDVVGARLSAAGVRKIRSLKGTMTAEAIADRYGLNKWTVHDILSGRTWAWLDDHSSPSSQL